MQQSNSFDVPFFAAISSERTGTLFNRDLL